MEWECATLDANVALPPGVCDVTVLITETELDEEYNDPTLVRLRGDLVIYGAGAAGSRASGAVGVIEVQGVPAAGADAAYCPFSECDADWIWHSFWHVIHDGVGGVNTGSVERFSIDSKAMRRLSGPDSILLFVIESDALSLGNVVYDFGIRFLLKG